MLDAIDEDINAGFHPWHALSLWAPWAWAILHAGKDIENRTWSPSPKLIGQRFWLHASLRGKTAGQMADDFEPVRDILEQLGQLRSAPPVSIRDLQALRGHVVGSVKLLGVTRDSDSPWMFGPVGLRLSEPVALAQPVPCRGSLGFFRLPHAVLRQCLEAAR